MLKVLLINLWDLRCEIEKTLQTEPGLEFIGCIDSKRSVVDIIGIYDPDVVVFNLCSSDDEWTLIEQINAVTNPPKIIAIATCDDVPFLREVISKGVDYYLMEPFSPELLARRIRHVVVFDNYLEFRRLLCFEQVREKARMYFDAIGMPTHYKGYHYLLEAIWLVFYDSQFLSSVTENLYPQIAQSFSTKSQLVERSIRNAIEVTWEQGNLDGINRLIPYGIDAEKGKPTNSAFISRVADLISFDIAPLDHD